MYFLFSISLQYWGEKQDKKMLNFVLVAIEKPIEVIIFKRTPLPPKINDFF